MLREVYAVFRQGGNCNDWYRFFNNELRSPLVAFQYLYYSLLISRANHDRDKKQLMTPAQVELAGLDQKD